LRILLNGTEKLDYSDQMALDLALYQSRSVGARGRFTHNITRSRYAFCVYIASPLGLELQI